MSFNIYWKINKIPNGICRYEGQMIYIINLAQGVQIYIIYSL